MAIKETLMKIIANEDDFYSAIAKEAPAVVLFSAEWCPDCRISDAFMPEIEEEFKGKADFYKADFDALESVREKYEVLGIPSFIIFGNGEEKARFVSTLRKTKAETEDFLSKNL